MTRVLIVFATTDGQTARIATFLAEEFRHRGVTVDVVRAGHPGAHAPEDYDGVVVAASLHAGGYQREVRRWVREHRAALAARATVFLSVGLAILQRESAVQRELAHRVARFLRVTGWTPDEVVHVAGALAYTRYGWLRRLVMRRIVRRAGGATDTSRDHEYTDWEALRRFAARWTSFPTFTLEHVDEHF